MEIFMNEIIKGVAKYDKLAEINKLIDWVSIRDILRRSKIRERETFDDMVMFKCLLVGRMHRLSYEELERSLHLRIDFRQFTGLGFEGKIPDKVTLWRYSDMLSESGIYDKLIEEINKQLEKKGLKIAEANCAIVDATLIASGSRPNGKSQEEVWDNQIDKVGDNGRKDRDARWFRKDRKSYYGHKGFIRTDADGMVEKVVVVPANEGEMGYAETMAKGAKSGSEFLADKGYTSEYNRKVIKEMGLIDGIMNRATRNHPLSEEELNQNYLISRKRFKVEQSFGLIKRCYGLARATTFTIARVAGEFAMACICLNLNLALSKSKFTG